MNDKIVFDFELDQSEKVSLKCWAANQRWQGIGIYSHGKFVIRCDNDSHEVRLSLGDFFLNLILSIEALLLKNHVSTDIYVDDSDGDHGMFIQANAEEISISLYTGSCRYI